MHWVFWEGNLPNFGSMIPSSAQVNNGSQILPRYQGTAQINQLTNLQPSFEAVSNLFFQIFRPHGLPPINKRVIFSNSFIFLKSIKKAFSQIKKRCWLWHIKCEWVWFILHYSCLSLFIHKFIRAFKVRIIYKGCHWFIILYIQLKI